MVKLKQLDFEFDGGAEKLNVQLSSDGRISIRLMGACLSCSTIAESIFVHINI